MEHIHLGISFREAGFRDIDTIRDLMYQVWPQTYTPIIPQEQVEYMIEWMYSKASLEQQIKDGHHYWIIAMNNIPCGYGSLVGQTAGIHIKFISCILLKINNAQD